MMLCVFGFILVAMRICVTGLHAWRFGDTHFAYNCKKNLGFDEHWKI